MSFRKYMHIERLGNQAVHGILDGKVYVFPKIDGTNASIWLEDGELKAGSRNREINEVQDNAGFYKWVQENKEHFLPFFEKNPDYTLYGEWLVPRTLKTYHEDAWRHFYIFDVLCQDFDKCVPFDVYAEALEEVGLSYILPMAILDSPSVQEVVDLCEDNKYLIAEGVGEGVVAKRYDFINRYGEQKWAKVIAEEFYKTKGERVRTITTNDGLEALIADEILTVAFVQKEKAKIDLEGWDKSKIGKLLGTIWHEFITEELWDILKKYKSPTINFKLLRGAVHTRAKKILEI